VIFSERRGARFLAVTAILLLATAVPAAGAETEAAAGDELASDSTLDRVGAVLGKAGEATFEVAILRPVGVAATAVGFVFFVASLPFVSPNLEIKTSWETFVMAPAEYTFTRPIGDF
jgi:hypothetical protein